MRRLVAFAFGFFLLALSVGRTQDALKSALTVDSVIERRPPEPAATPPDQPHLGPVQLLLGAYTGLELNDNVNASQTAPESDLLLRAGLNLGFAWPATPQSQLQLGSSLGYVHYTRHPGYDHMEVSPNSILDWSIGFDDGSISFFDQFSYSQSVLSESALSSLATFPLLNNTIGTRLQVQPGQLRFELGYSHNNLFSDSTQFEYLNSSSEYLLARAMWCWAEKSQAGLEISLSTTRYEQSSQSGNRSLSAGPYVEWQITQSLKATLRGGPVLYVFDSPPSAGAGKDLRSWYFGCEMVQDLTSFISQHLNVQRSVRQGLNQGSDYIQQLTASYGLFWSMTQSINLGLGFAYEQGNQPYLVPVYIFPFGTFTTEETEYYNRYGANLSMYWKASDHLTASLAYNYWLRDSNVFGNAYSVNSVSATLTYGF